jgi:hypothetical protein
MSHILGWMCLVLVASTTAYGLQLTAVAMVPSVAGADQVTSETFTRNVLIVAVNPVTGDRAQVEFCAPPDSFASDVLIVTANDFPAVAQLATS